MIAKSNLILVFNFEFKITAHYSGTTKNAITNYVLYKEITSINISRIIDNND